MDLAIAHELIKSVHLKSIFQAVLLTAREDGYTVAELARQLGVPKRTLYRWIEKAKARQLDRPRNPRAELHSRPAGAPAGPCNHSNAFFLGRRRVCLDCLASNLERDLSDQRRTDEAERRARRQPAPKFKPKGMSAAS